MPIDQYITNEIFWVFLVFCRVGTCFMLLPGFGDAYVSPRVRLFFCLALSLALVNAVPQLPKMPGEAMATMIIVFHEIVIGLLIGGVIKILTSAIHIAGIIIGMQSSLGQASLFDPSQQSQGAVFGTFLQMMALVMIFSLDFHHLMIEGIISSYLIFSPSEPLPWQDFSELAIKSLSQSFAIGMQISAPLIIIGLVINVISGVLARLMPAFQVFFVIMPVQILAALFIFMVSLSSMLLIYMAYLNNSMVDIFPQK